MIQTKLTMIMALVSVKIQLDMIKIKLGASFISLSVFLLVKTCIDWLLLSPELPSVVNVFQSFFCAS